MVNVILTDTRALDTFGEVIVLMVVAVGILTLSTKRGRASGRLLLPRSDRPGADVGRGMLVEEVAR